jgi:hypothetical protein
MNVYWATAGVNQLRSMQRLAIAPVMYRFPHTTDPQFLIDQEVAQIAPDVWSLQFRFVNGTKIAVQGRIEHVDEAGQAHPPGCQLRTGAAI